MDHQALHDYVYHKYGLKFQPAPDDPRNEETIAVIPHQPFAVLATTSSELDVRCSSFADTIRDLPNFTEPRLVNHPDWVGVDLQKISNHDLENVLDYAFKVASNGNSRFVAQQLVYLPTDETESPYQAQKIPARAGALKKRQAPGPLQKMRESYNYEIMPADVQGYNFYHQGQMVAQYEDDYDQIYELKRYYPDYHSMTLNQLRTYFTWRTQLRQGNFTVSSTSYAYVYIYELLNNIGVKDPNDGYQKLEEFYQRYADNYGSRMIELLHQWMQDYVLYYGLDRQIANRAFADKLDHDRQYHVLLHPDDYDADQLIQIFLDHSPYLKKCRLYKNKPDAWANVVKLVWQTVMKKQPNAYTQLIATQALTSKYFFSGAVFYFRQQPKLREYPIDSERKYQFKDRKYYCQVWYPLKDQQKRLNTFFHELDRLARQKFHLGHPLKPRELDDKILQAISDGLDQYLTQRKEAQRPKIKINLSDLEQIRSDASTTRDNLLTDEEIADDQVEAESSPENQQQPEEDEPSEQIYQGQKEDPDEFQNFNAAVLGDNKPSDDTEDVPQLSADEHFLLMALLNKQPYADYLKQHHLMASILVDSINDKLFDVIGDSVIEFDDQDQPQIIEDYEPDLKDLFLNKGD